MSSAVNSTRILPSAMVAWVAWVRMSVPAGLLSSSNPEYPRIWSLSVMATAMAAVEGSSSRQISCAACLFMPFFMLAKVWLASRSMASDWRARTESGSMSNRMTMTSENVKTMPAAIMMAMLRNGVKIDQMSTSPAARHRPFAGIALPAARRGSRAWSLPRPSRSCPRLESFEALPTCGSCRRRGSRQVRGPFPVRSPFRVRSPLHPWPARFSRSEQSRSRSFPRPWSFSCLQPCRADAACPASRSGKTITRTAGAANEHARNGKGFAERARSPAKPSAQAPYARSATSPGCRIRSGPAPQQRR